MKKIFIALITICFATSSCNDFVDVIPKGNTIPETVDDLAKLMTFGTFTTVSPYFTDISISVGRVELYCDDYMTTQDPDNPNYYTNFTTFIAEMMKWEDPSEGSDTKWNTLYKSNYVANYVLDNIDRVKAGVAYDRDETKGWALVHRAMNYFILVNLYGKQYDASPGSTSSTDLGVPMPLESDINKKYPRATVERVYGQIMDDLTQAISLMKTEVSKFSALPCLASAYAIRARVNLWMQNYDQAYSDAVKSLTLNNGIIDYTTCSQVVPGMAPAGIAGYPSEAVNNPEVVYARYKTETTPTMPMAITDQENDLRHTLFSYYSGPYFYMYYGYHSTSGLNAGEIWLTRAEAALRKSSPDKTDAVNSLDYLRVRRYTPESYEPTDSGISDADLLSAILLERRREIRMCEIAFFDVKRLNLDPATARSMSRTFLGEVYTLPLGDPRWQLLLPRDVVQMNPLLVQNER